MPLDIYKHKIGDAEITQIVELEFGGLVQGLLPHATKEEIEKIEWIGPFVKEDMSLHAISQSFFVKVNNRLLVLDTCIGNEKDIQEMAGWNNMNLPYLQAMEEAGIDRFKVTDVLCSHLHVDHVGWNTYKKDGKWLPTFPNAKYHFAQSEYDYWTKHQPENSFDELQKVVFQESVEPIVEAGLTNFVATDANLGDGMQLISTPGHTHSHVSLQITSGDKTFILGGDMSHHPVQIANTDWTLALDYNGEQSTATRNKLFSEIADTPTIFTCTHFSLPSFGHVTKDVNGKFAFKLIEK